MKVGPTKYSKGGETQWSRYVDGGATALSVGAPGYSAPDYRASVNLADWGVPAAPHDCIWVKTWSENQGVWEALVAAGVLTDTAGTASDPFGNGCVARLGRFTPTALAERDEAFAAADA